MPVYYIETSALLKKYRTEKGTDAVEELFQEKHENDRFVTSYLTLLESVSVVTRMFKSGSFSRRLYQATLGNLERDSSRLMSLDSVSDAVISEAIKQSMTHALRAPDAIHLASALRISSASNEKIYFLCSDTRLKTACLSSGLLVLDPEDPGSVDDLRRWRAVA